MIIIGLLDSRLEDSLDVNAEGTDVGSRKHTYGHMHTNMHSFTVRIYTTLPLTMSPLSLFSSHNFVHTPAKVYE